MPIDSGYPDPQNPKERFMRLISENVEDELYQSMDDGITTLGDTKPIPSAHNESAISQNTSLDWNTPTILITNQGEIKTRPVPETLSKPGSPKAGLPKQESPGTPQPVKKKPLRAQKKRSSPTINWRNAWGCLIKGSVIASFMLVISGLCLMSFLFYQYYRIAATLPDINDLRSRASSFETTRILDRYGNTLYEIIDPNAGRRTYVPLSRISPYLVAATVATEDKDFYSHPGVDLAAIVRAFWQNYQGGGTVSGASTITQQLARTLLFSSEERVEITYRRKVREAILATEITRRYSKDEILEIYLNENNYGNLAYGIEAAAETYFRTTADQLTLGQAAFLAGLPQAPAIYDVYTNPDLTMNRLEDVMVLMYEASQEDGCIYVSNNPEKICIDPVAVTQAVDEIKNYPFQSPDIEMRYPHWVNYVRTQLESLFDPQTIYRSGFNVYTTIDPGIQDFAQEAIEKNLQTLQDQNVTNSALVVIRPVTGEILAMIGSADFENEAISGQVNMAISPRQPGSAIKPLTYLAAFEKGWTTSTLIWDVPSEFTPSGLPDDPGPTYVPENYSGKFYGPITVRRALANSLNIPAVKTLQFVGVYDDPLTPQEDGLISMAKRLGITTLTRPDYGLSLTLGGGDVSLLELTGVYATLANSGRYIKPVAISRIEDRNGNIVFEYTPPAGEQVLRPEHVYLMSSILADNESRVLAFGRNSILNLPFQAAVKTGTTNSFRDNWTLGYTPDIAVGVWAGNADYTPMENTTGLSGAGPVWASVMQEAIRQLTGNSPSPLIRPAGIAEHAICALSGTFPSQWCKRQTTELFASDQPPLPKEEDLIQVTLLDSWTGLRASGECGEFTVEKLVLNVQDSWARRWLRKDPQGQSFAQELGFDKDLEFLPNRACKSDDPRPKLSFVSPRGGETITTSPLQIQVIADATEWFEWVRLDYGLGPDPVSWQALEQRNNPVKDPGVIYEWDLTDFPPGPVVLRLVMRSTEGTTVEVKLPLNIQIPTPTPTQTPIPTDTPIPTSTPTATPTETLAPWPTETPVLPSETPTPTVSP
jgi:penicillin-binding protein 1C